MPVFEAVKLNSADEMQYILLQKEWYVAERSKSGDNIQNSKVLHLPLDLPLEDVYSLGVHREHQIWAEGRFCSVWVNHAA